MNKIIAILILVFLYSSCKQEAYNDVASTALTKEMFVGKWTVSYVDQGYYVSIDSVVLINSDNTISVLYSNSYHTGTWSLNGNYLTSDILSSSSNPKNTTYTIETISDKELILNANSRRVKFIKN